MYPFSSFCVMRTLYTRYKKLRIDRSSERAQHPAWQLLTGLRGTRLIRCLRMRGRHVVLGAGLPMCSSFLSPLVLLTLMATGAAAMGQMDLSGSDEDGAAAASGSGDDAASPERTDAERRAAKWRADPEHQRDRDLRRAARETQRAIREGHAQAELDALLAEIELLNRDATRSDPMQIAEMQEEARSLAELIEMDAAFRAQQGAAVPAEPPAAAAPGTAQNNRMAAMRVAKGAQKQKRRQSAAVAEGPGTINRRRIFIT